MIIFRKLLALVLCFFIVASSSSMVYAQEAPASPSPVIEEPTPTPTALEPTLDDTNLSASYAATVQDPAASIGINAPALSVRVGNTLSLSASVLPATASQSVVWTSSDTYVATVSASGLVTPWEKGNVTITAITSDGTDLSAQVELTVLQPFVSSIKLNCPDTVMAGTEFDCTLEVLPENAADRSVTFEQDNYGFVYIDSATLRGTASSAGQMTVTVTANDGSGVSFSKTITVTPRLVDTVVIDYCPSTLRLNETAYLLASCLPYNAADPTLSYTSSNPSVVQVDNSGLLQGLALGQATITVAATDGSNVSTSQVVTVLPPYPDRIIMNFANLTLALGEVNTMLKATPIPSNADATFLWSSTNTSVATVDESGRITAVGLGYAAIYAASPNGATNYCSVYVVSPGQAATSITLNKTSASIVGGKDLQLNASVLPKEAADKSVRWSSSDTAVAYVSGDGTVCGFAPGVAVITATAASGISAQCTIYVKTLSVSQVVLSEDYLELDVGKTAILKASLLPSNASFKAVTWSYGDPAVAIVSKNGKITATGHGTTVIIASAPNGVNVSCTVTVP